MTPVILNMSFSLSYLRMFRAYPVIPEAARVKVRIHCSFGASGRFQVKMVVAVTHTKASL